MSVDTKFPPRTPEESAIAALAFFDVFEYALNLAEIQRYMAGFSLTKRDIKILLGSIDRIETVDGLYFLEGRSSLVEERKRRAAIADKYWEKVGRFVPYLKAAPFVKAVAVCNTLAFGSPSESSDIDLFIITEKDRIFTARTFSTALFDILGVRRKGSDVAGRFCLSFYLSEDEMDLSEMRRGENDVYLAYWMRSLRPLFGEQIFDEFLAQNVWLTEMFPENAGESGRAFFLNTGGVAPKVGRVQRSLLSRAIGSRLEGKLEKDHLKRHASRKSDLGEESCVVVDRKMLKYHNVDRRDEFNEEFFRRYGSSVSS